MQLEHLCDLVLDYDGHGLTMVRPFAGHEAQAFGTGTGSAQGGRLTGDVRWANYPRMRDDGVLMPDVRGVVSTEEGPVLFEIRGYSEPAPEGGDVRHVTGSLRFRTEAPSYRWLNTAIAVHEGQIDFTTMSTRFPTYICVPDWK